MTNLKTTKRALLSSVTALLVCFTMLLGSTFAWFTDSVTSGSNVIKSGNLDMKVSYKPYGAQNTEWTEVNDSTVLFGKDARYEPGYTEAVWLKVENLGSLAFRYDLAINVSEKQGTNKAGEKFSLSDHLVVKYMTTTSTDMESNFYTTRESLDSFNFGGTTNSGVTSLSDDIAVIKNGVAFPASDAVNGAYSSAYVLVVISMPTTVGDEANHNGIDIPEINFSLTALATQLAYESDNFGSGYDNDAEYPIIYDHFVSDLDGLKAAFAKGGNVILEDDITFEKITAIEPGVEVYLNLNGKKITVNQQTTSNTLIWVKDGAKLTIDGNGTIDLGGVSTMAIFCPYGELVIENGTFIRDKVTTVTDKTTGLFMGAKITGSNVTINGGYFDPGYYDKNAADIEGILAGTVDFTETEDDIAKRGNSKDANLVRVAVKDNVSVLLNHSGYGSFKVYGGTFVGANPAWGDEGCMLPTTPNYLRPWSYYQGALLDGQTYNENGLVIPAGYTITQTTNDDGVPVYTVTYNK